MLSLSISPEEKIYYEDLMNSRTEALIFQLEWLNADLICQNQNQTNGMQPNGMQNNGIQPNGMQSNGTQPSEPQSNETQPSATQQNEIQPNGMTQIETQQFLTQENDYLYKNTLSKEELSYFNGQNGKQAFVAVDGIIYDVTNDSAWGAGKSRLFITGRDLSPFFRSEEKKEELLYLPIVGYLR
jgi:predicted heme/steroid binding protein